MRKQLEEILLGGKQWRSKCNDIQELYAPIIQSLKESNELCSKLQMDSIQDKIKIDHLIQELTLIKDK